MFNPGDPNFAGEKAERYRWEGDMTMLKVEDVEKFVEHYGDGNSTNKLKPYRRSE